MLVFIFVSTAGDPMPADGLALFGVAPLQFASLIMTFGMLISRGKFRRVPEFWVLVAYWIPLAIGILGPRGYMRFCKVGIFLAAVAFPVVGGLRLVYSWRCRAKSRAV
jgi:hypothetical protein